MPDQNQTEIQTPVPPHRRHIPFWIALGIIILVAGGVGYWVLSQSSFCCVLPPEVDKSELFGSEAVALCGPEPPIECEVGRRLGCNIVNKPWSCVYDPDYNKTAGWQTYRNEEHGFEIKIPSNWSVNEVDNVLWFDDPSTEKVEGSGYDVFFKNSEDNVPAKTTRVVTINDYEWTRIQSEGIALDDISYILNFKGRTYMFVALDIREDTLKQILNTFKFIESAQATNLFLSRAAIGGLCVYGMCKTSTEINSDGTFVIKENDQIVQDGGQINPEKMEEIELLISSTDFDSVRARPFTNICPTAYDGQENVYTFYTKTGVEIVSDCQINIDYSSGLFGYLFPFLNRLYVLE